ncbi:hypothetical protein VPH35_049111 [Triticum aestivum]
MAMKTPSINSPPTCCRSPHLTLSSARELAATPSPAGQLAAAALLSRRPPPVRYPHLFSHKHHTSTCPTPPRLRRPFVSPSRSALRSVNQNQGPPFLIRLGSVLSVFYRGSRILGFPFLQTTEAGRQIDPPSPVPATAS